MRNAGGALITLLTNSRHIIVADLLTIAQSNGTITRRTSAPSDLTAVSQWDAASHLFASSGPHFKRGSTKLVVGMEVDTLNLTLMCNPVADLIGGVPWPTAAIRGDLDEARIMVERVFMATYGTTSAGTLIVFKGMVGRVEPARDEVRIEVVSDLALLRHPFPRNTYQPGCIHTLYDAGCTLSRAALGVNGAAVTGSTPKAVLTTLGQATGYFDLGTMTFTSGLNIGLSRTIATFVSATSFSLAVAFPYTVVAGDTFTVFPGCDKKQATCSTKFSNLAHFRGYPYIPSPVTAR